LWGTATADFQIEMRFGLYRADYETKKRIPTKAVRVYKQIATSSL